MRHFASRREQKRADVGHERLALILLRGLRAVWIAPRDSIREKTMTTGAANQPRFHQTTAPGYQTETATSS